MMPIPHHPHLAWRLLMSAFHLLRLLVVVLACWSALPRCFGIRRSLPAVRSAESAPALVRHVGILVGAGLGSLNWLLLAVWPLLLAGVFMSSRHEEELLREKFACESPAD
jgi:hypothetical protein